MTEAMIDWLLTPVSDEHPCGPDLEAEGSPDFIDYYYEAEARLPERYVTPGMSGIEGSMDRVFDPKSVNLRAETQSMTELLRRSRDLRLLSLMARFQILAARPTEFADTLQAMAELLAQWPADTHPQVNGSVSERRAALDELGSMKTVVMPLQYLPLVGQADATYRRFLVASGQASARASEEGADRGAIVAALALPAYEKQVTRLHGDLGRAAQALARINALCAGDAAGPFRPSTHETLQALTGMQQLLKEARSELVLWSDESLPEPETPEQPADDTPAAPAAPSAVPVSAGAITDRAGVHAALAGAERYLARQEPSSPALLLVTQARLLIGRPLIEALETLLPADAAKAVIGFSPETGFAVAMDRMKVLSSSALGGFDDEQPTDSVVEPVKLTSRAEVAAQLRAVEEFYVAQEPASPIPILLSRARGLMDKGFQAIVAELLPGAEMKG